MGDGEGKSDYTVLFFRTYFVRESTLKSKVS